MVFSNVIIFCFQFKSGFLFMWSAQPSILTEVTITLDDCFKTNPGGQRIALSEPWATMTPAILMKLLFFINRCQKRGFFFGVGTFPLIEMYIFFDKKVRLTNYFSHQYKLVIRIHEKNNLVRITKCKGKNRRVQRNLTLIAKLDCSFQISIAKMMRSILLSSSFVLQNCWSR